MLTELAQKSLTPIDLSATVLNQNHSRHNLSLATILIKEKQFNFLENCLEKYFSQENGHEMLNHLIEQHPDLHELHQLIAYLDIKYKTRLLQQLLQQGVLDDNFKSVFDNLWRSFDTIEKHGFHYTEIQEMKGNLLLALVDYPDIAAWAADDLIKLEIQECTRLYPSALLEEKLKACAINAFADAGLGKLCANLYLQLSNPAKITHQQSIDLTPADGSVSDDRQLQPRMQQKTEKASDNDYAFFSSSTSSFTTASCSSSPPTSSTLPENNP